MSIEIQGGLSGNVAEVDPTHRALRAANRPTEYGALGHYRFAAVTGTMAAALAAGAVVFSARWAAAAGFALITRLRLRFMPLTPFTGATLTDHTSFNLFRATTFTASHTGGNAITPSKMRTAMPASAFTDIRLASTAALGAGAGLTLDAQPIAMSLRRGNRTNPAAATEETIPPLDDAGLLIDVGSGEHPVVLGTSEGLVMTNRTVWPAAGTGIILVEMAWSEAAAY